MRLKSYTFFRLTALLVLFGASIFSIAATVTGTVTDKTTNKPAGGDDVALIAFGQGMQVAAQTKTDNRGHYSIDVTDNGMHLIRVTHQKAAYFQPLQPGSKTADVDVYDVAEHVVGVKTEADVLRIETDPQGLHVIENFFVRNDSNPPRTQFSDHAYEISLPAGAKIDGAAAMGPSGMPVSSSPMPVSGQKDTYAFIFPIRPNASGGPQQPADQGQGETRFQVSYHLPYSGSFSFKPHIFLATDNIAVMLPKSMTFQSSGSAFQPINDDVNAQTFLARKVAAGETLAFSVSGTGSMPRDSQNGDQGQGAQAADQGGAAVQSNRPGGGLGTPIDTPDPLQKYKWWILSGLALLLAAAAAFLLRGAPAAPAETIPEPLVPTTRGAHAPANNNSLLQVLKDELFAIETEKLEGKLTDREYAELKAALETVLRRALSRQAIAANLS